MKNPYIDLIQAVWQNGKPWRTTIVGYYIAFIIAQTFYGFSPYTLGRTIDVLQHFTPGRLHEVVFWMAASVAVLILFWLFHGPARVKEREVAMKIQQAFRTRIYEQLTELPLKWHQDHHSGNIISRLNRASNALYRFAGDQFIYIETIIKFIVSTAFLLWLSFPVGIAMFISCFYCVVV
jgi:ATP-binding cassette subfamily B protein